MIRESGDRIGTERRHWTAKALRCLVQDGPRKNRQVFLSFPQGWNQDWKNIETIKEVRAKSSLLHETLQRLVRSCDDSHVNPYCFFPSKPLEFPFLR